MTDTTPDPMANDDVDDPWHDAIEEASDSFGAPEVLAPVAFVLAVASLLGFGLMNGSVYVLPFINDPNDDASGLLVMSAVVGAALALLPVWLGWRTSARLLDDDPSWVGVLARVAVVLGLASGALRLVAAFIQAVTDGPDGFTRL